MQEKARTEERIFKTCSGQIFSNVKTLSAKSTTLEEVNEQEQEQGQKEQKQDEQDEQEEQEQAEK